MHKVKYLKVEITKGKMQKIVREVPQWEAQVLIALWGDEAQILGETSEMRELPEANDEFTRLANKYGPRDEDVPMVARVYGSFGPGVRALEQEFSASTMSIETETAVEEVAVADDAGGIGGVASGNGAEAGVQLPGSDATFGPDAVPKAVDDVPFYAGNSELEQAMADAETRVEDIAETAEKLDTALTPPVADYIADLTGEEDGDAQTE